MEKRQLTLLAGIILLAAIIRFFRLGGQSFWIDEIFTVGSYMSPPGGIPYWKKLLWDMHGPLYSLIMHFWSIASSSEAWLRLPGATAGVLSVLFMYRWTSMMTDRGTATTAALILALSPFHLYYSQELRFYSLLTLFVILSLISFRKFLDGPSPARGIKLGIMLGLTCMAHFMALFFCGGLLLYMLASRKAKGEYLRYGALAALIALLMISPWIYREIYFLRQIRVVDISELSEQEKLRGDLTLSVWSYPYILYAFSVGYSFGPDLRSLHFAGSGFELLSEHWAAIVPVYLVFGILFAYGLVQSRRTDSFSLFLSIMAVTVLGTTAATLKNIKVFNVRYLMPAFPVFIAVIAIGVPVKKRRRAAVLAAALIPMAVSVWNYHMVDEYARDDIRGSARIIEAEEREGDAVMVPDGELLFGHYYAGGNETVFFSPRSIGAEEAASRTMRVAGEHERVWYVRWRQWDTDPGDVMMNTLSEASSSASSWKLPGVTVFLFEFERGD